jgi:hypothetical protein
VSKRGRKAVRPWKPENRFFFSAAFFIDVIRGRKVELTYGYFVFDLSRQERCGVPIREPSQGSS